MTPPPNEPRSFGVVAWECVARAVPYEGMNGVQAALAVVNRGLRPDIPAHTPPALAELIRACWAPVPEQRPNFEQAAAWLAAILEGMQQVQPWPQPRLDAMQQGPPEQAQQHHQQLQHQQLQQHVQLQPVQPPPQLPAAPPAAVGHVDACTEATEAWADAAAPVVVAAGDNSGGAAAAAAVARGMEQMAVAHAEPSLDVIPAPWPRVLSPGPPSMGV